MSPTYFPIQKQWRRLKPLFERLDVLNLMHEEMECYAKARAEDYGYEHKPQPFTPWLRPEDYDSADWRWCGNRAKPGRKPSYWSWACVGACHWVASHNLMVVSLLEPDRPWQISTSDEHSTVVDMERELLFDPTFMALGLTPEECWQEAVEHHTAELLPVGIYMNHAAPDAA